MTDTEQEDSRTFQLEQKGDKLILKEMKVVKTELPLEMLNRNPEFKIGEYDFQFKGFNYKASLIGKKNLFITRIEGLIPFRILIDPNSISDESNDPTAVQDWNMTVVRNGSVASRIQASSGAEYVTNKSIHEVNNLFSMEIFMKDCVMEVHDHIKSGGKDIYIKHATKRQMPKLANIFPEGRVCTGVVDASVGRISNAKLAMMEMIRNTPNLDLAYNATVGIKFDEKMRPIATVQFKRI